MTEISLYSLILSEVKNNSPISRRELLGRISPKVKKIDTAQFITILMILEKKGHVRLEGKLIHYIPKKSKIEPVNNKQETDSISLKEGLLIGKRYVLEKLLGSGTYGAVWKARDKKLDRTVAIKFLHQGLKDFEQLEKEGKALSALTHKNILVVHDLGSDETRGWLVTEFIDGPSLEVYLAKKATDGSWISFEDAKEIITQCLEGLEFAHDKERVHGDIKPGNIFFPQTGEIKLGDFGVAKILNNNESNTEEYPPGYNRLLGSPSCMAPEVLNGKPRDFQSDLFSVGVLAYILLTEQHPFMHKSGLLPISELTKNESYTPKKPSELNNSIPEKYEKIVLRLLERDKNNRYKKARDVLNDWREKPDTVKCPSCNVDNPVLNKFCGQCGDDLRATRESETVPEKDLSTSFALFTSGRPIEAIEIMKRSLNTNQDFAKGWAHLGYMLNSERKYEEAEKACTKSIKIDPQSSNSYQTRGFARSNLSKFDEAIKDFTNANNLEQDEKRKASILYQRGYSFMLAGSLNDAYNDVIGSLTCDSTNKKAQILKTRIERLLQEK